MTLAPGVREQVRQRAGQACEFCGVSETDAGGALTVDHFQPQSKGGSDDVGNLVYSCIRCNQYKGIYWPSNPTDIPLWNPRNQSWEEHFLLLDDGTLHPLTDTGAFTLRRLRLNRAPLVSYRYSKIREEEDRRLLTRQSDLIRLLEQLLAQQNELMAEQRQLLEEQRGLVQLLLARRRSSAP